MLLNRLETVLMNNPLRAAFQRHVEASRLLRMGGPMDGGRALEIGCGRGVGAELILDRFGADRVDGFDLDPVMVVQAGQRLRGREARFWVGDATSISAADSTYDAVFDFGILHHVVDWRRALSEVHRVLKPEGVFFAQESMETLIHHPVLRRLLEHPREDRFNQEQLLLELHQIGMNLVEARTLGPYLSWLVARKLPTS